MRIEVLYPEVCNLCADLTNVRYLKMCCPEIEVIETALNERPKFLDEPIELVYLGTSTEHGLELVINALGAVREELIAKLDAGQFLLGTGNALDAFGARITSDQGLDLEGLDLFGTTARYKMMRRHNSFFLGTYAPEDGSDQIEILGFKSLFGLTYDAPETEGLFTTVRGFGRSEATSLEGFHRKNVFLTHLTGPLLVLNPLFTKLVLRKMGAPEVLALEDEIMDAYYTRITDFKDEHRNPLY